MVITATVRISAGIASLVGDVLDDPIPEAVMVTGVRIEIVLIPTAAIRCEHVVEIKNGDVIMVIGCKPVIYQPSVESASVSSMGCICVRRVHWGRSYHNEELILPRSEVLQQGRVLSIASVANCGVVRQHAQEGGIGRREASVGCPVSYSLVPQESRFCPVVIGLGDCQRSKGCN